MPATDPIDWLLESDDENPSVRYFALRELVGLPEADERVQQARSPIMVTGPVPAILEAQSPDGYWAKEGSGYSPKYRATSWSLLLLAELGAEADDPRVQSGGRYLLEHSLAANEAFSVYQKPVPSGAVHCLNGNMIFALQRLGFGDDPRVVAARGWLARSIIGEEPINYYKSAVAAPGFVCGVSQGQPCAWGANKAVRGLLEVPAGQRTPLEERALEAGAQLLLSRDPAQAEYPYTGRVSSTWFKLGFPLSYWSDVLETISNLAKLGYADDPRLANALDWLAEKQDDRGRWKLENNLNGKIWADIEAKGKASKWVTLRALIVLKLAGRLPKPA